MQDPAPVNTENTSQAAANVQPQPRRGNADTAEESQNKGGMLPASEKECLETVVPDYALLFFDHLHSEYLTLKPLIVDEEVIRLLDAIHEKRRSCQLAWSDVYTFDLALVRVRPPVSLIRKAYDARAKYRSFAGQKEYDEYVASNPPNLIEIKVVPNAQPPEPDVIVENRLRADVEYLLSKFYLYYATLPARERLRDELTQRAVRRTLMFVGVLVVLMLVNLGVVSLFQSFFNAGSATPGLTMLTVALAGIVGGCVSTLQRIQSAPSEGDALFNLAALNNGWTGLSLSPLYGGIFASLLFVLFAAGILKGSVFPEIHTPSKPVSSAATASAKPTPPATLSANPVASPAPTVSGSPATVASTTPANPASPSPAATSSPAAANPTTKGGSPQTEPAQTSAVSSGDGSNGILRVKTFLEETGPVDGISYALLIVWSFLAGFAERLVPDTLNRLVAKNQALQGG